MLAAAWVPGAGGRLPHTWPGCRPGTLQPVGSESRAWVVVADGRVTARTAPNGGVIAHFQALNANQYPTLFGVRGRIVDGTCRAQWYYVQLPLRPNGATGFVPARGLLLASVRTRIEVDLSARTLRLFEDGRLRLRTGVTIGSRATPTPIGRFYVNQRLRPASPGGPFGPGALGLSAFSDVLIHWAQGGPIAIHGTNEPWTIGQAVSHGCIRVRNHTLSWLFDRTPAGTPVVIHP